MVVPAPLNLTDPMPNTPMSDSMAGGAMEPPENEDDSETEESTEMEGKSALLPKSMFPGEPKVGDTLTIKIQALYSDEAEITVVSRETETKKPAMMSADEELDSMGGAEME